jgi:uncharacterized protein (DUF1501 family)
MADIRIATRREFLAQGLGIIGVGATLPNYLIQTAAAGPKAQADERLIVVIQLSGGHDAISALVPYGHEEYAKVRRATRIADGEVVKLNNELGLHPRLAGFKALLDEGAFAAVPGVGYPNPNYSHFTATDIWHMADERGRAVPYGWLGRACDVGFKESREPALSVAVGMGQTPLAMVGRHHPGLSFNQPESFRYTGDRGDEKRAGVYRKLNELAIDGAASNLQWVAQTAVAANATSDRVRAVARDYKGKVEYPRTGLGTALRTIAGLIVGGMRTRIFYCSQGGYDTHRGQRQRHDQLMAQLNDTVFAFQKDLAAQKQSERVLTFTMSEFGRRVKENGSDGTDHGAAATLFLFGPGLKAGVHGKHPSLTDLQGGGGGSLKHTTEFRSVYATVLEKWLGVPAEPVLGKSYPLLDLLRTT